MAASEIIRPIVLIVDDEPAVLEALRLTLAPRLEPLYQVEAAASAEEALELAATLPPETRPLAAVISDEKMPGRQGTDLLIALRQSPAHRNGGRIIVTGYAGLESAKRAINEAEVVRYFPKPWDDEGQLVPALAEILSRFARDSDLDNVLLCAVHPWEQARPDIESIRRAWWEYITLMGMSAAEAEVEEPLFIEPEDATGLHAIARRRSPQGEALAASLRLDPGQSDAPWRLSAIAFVPEEANEASETLLLRAAALEARLRGARLLEADVPILRRDVFAALGFASVGPHEPEAVSVHMILDTSRLDAVEGPARRFAIRHERERRQCLCAQSACTNWDYAERSRAYFCPLDSLEGRLPTGFPGGSRS